MYWVVSSHSTVVYVLYTPLGQHSPKVQFNQYVYGLYAVVEHLTVLEPECDWVESSDSESDARPNSVSEWMMTDSESAWVEGGSQFNNRGYSYKLLG